MHKGLLRTRDVDQGVINGGPFAQPRTDGDQQVTALYARSERGVQPHRHIADVMRVTVVDHVLRAIRTRHRQIERLRKGEKIVAAFFVPAAAAENHHRFFGFGQHVAQPVHVGFAGVGGDALITGEFFFDGSLQLHVFRQRQHHRAGAAGGGDVKSVADHFLHAVGAVYARHPLRHLAIHAAVIDFLKRFALDHFAIDLTDK